MVHVLEDHALRILLKGDSDQTNDVGMFEVGHQLGFSLEIAPGLLGGSGLQGLDGHQRVSHEFSFVNFPKCSFAQLFDKLQTVMRKLAKPRPRLLILLKLWLHESAHFHALVVLQCPVNTCGQFRDLLLCRTSFFAVLSHAAKADAKAAQGQGDDAWHGHVEVDVEVAALRNAAGLPIFWILT